MAKQEILKLGNPALHRLSRSVALKDRAKINTLVKDIIDTMYANNGAGLAAPQINEPWRVIAFGIEKNSRYPDVEPIPLTVIVNPQIEILDHTLVEGWEGCLSIPGMRGLVPRYTSLRYRGFDVEGAAVEQVCEGFHARVVQHEYDHLDGILYPQRITDMTKFGFITELEKAGLIPGVES